MAVTFTSVLAFALLILFASQAALMGGSEPDESENGGRIRLLD